MLFFKKTLKSDNYQEKNFVFFKLIYGGIIALYGMEG